MEALSRLIFGDDKGWTSKRRFFTALAFAFVYLALRIASRRDPRGGRSALQPLLFLPGESDEAREQQQIAEIQGFRPSFENRVISFSFSGADPRFTTGAIRNAELASIYFPGWKCRFYIDDSVPDETVARLTDLQAEIVTKTGGGSIFWKFLVADDPNVDRFVVRDVDTRLNARDRFAVEEWISSGKSVHVMRDHLCHGYRVLGGLWGAVRDALPLQMAALMKNWPEQSSSFGAANFLSEKLFPLVVDDHLAHDTYTCEKFFPHALPFPTKRLSSFQFVGQPFDANNRPQLQHISSYICGGIMMYTPAPEACRRHSSWIFG